MGNTNQSEALHAAIMNLPCKPTQPRLKQADNYEVGYKFGHRDARHAAAELVAAHEARMLTGREAADVWALKLSRDAEAIELVRRFCEVNGIRLSPAPQES